MFLCFSEIEEAVRKLQAKKEKLVSEVTEEDRVGLGSEGHFDLDIYGGGGGRYDGGYVTSIAANDEQDVSLTIHLLSFIRIL